MKLRELFVNIVFSTVIFVVVIGIGIMAKNESFMSNKKENNMTFDNEEYDAQKVKRQLYAYENDLYMPFDVCSPVCIKDYEYYDEISDETQSEVKKEINESSVSTEY